VLTTSAEERYNETIIICLPYEAAFPELFKFISCILREIMISEFPSRVTTCKRVSIEWLPAEMKVTDKNDQIFPTKFSMGIPL
jgi:hypothetical protein